MLNHSLIRALTSLRGNPRACVYTEPLWAIPFHLFIPFAAVFMAALAVTDQQIGLIASAAMLVRAVFSLLGGVIADKIGRKRTTFIFDLISWTIPCLLWAFSQNFWWFLIAAMLNGMGEVTANSWNCLLIEDANKSTLVDIYAWVHISGLLAVFFAPLAGLLIERLDLVLAVRIIYLFSFVSMTLKFVILNKYATETGIGIKRMEETRDSSLLSLIAGYGGVVRKLFHSSRMMLALFIATVFIVTSMVTGTFFGLYAVRNLDMPEFFLAYFPIIRAVIMLLFLFVIQPKIARFRLKVPMLVGISLYIAAYALLIVQPPGNLLLLLVCIFLESCAHSLIWPRRDSIHALFIAPGERARLNSVIASVIFIITIPFGYLSGWMSSLDARYPFMLIILIFAVQFIVVFLSRALRTSNIRALEAAQTAEGCH